MPVGMSGLSFDVIVLSAPTSRLYDLVPLVPQPRLLAAERKYR
jgi:hypothetical protein